MKPISAPAERWWFAAVCAVTLLAYIRSFASPFQLDDYSYIVGNRVLEAPSLEGVLGYGRARILAFATFLLNDRIGGENPFGYHVVNFAIHLLATLAVYELVLTLCRTPRLRETWLATQRLPAAVAAAFVFACHPIQIQAVTYIVQRMSSMAALFYIGSVLLYARARNAQLGLQSGRPALAYTGAALLALAAFLSKENSASLPLAILLTEWTFYPGTGARERIKRLVPFLVLVAVIPLAWFLFGTRPGRAPGGDAPFAEHAQYFVNLIFFRASPGGTLSPLDYFLTQCVVIPRYLRLVLLPWGFNIDHDVPPAGASAAAVAGLVFLVSLLGFGLYSARRWPMIGFGVVWLFLALSVESSFLPIKDAMVEHRMYLAMAGVALVAGTVFAHIVRRHPRPALIAGAVAVSIMCTLTYLRNELWRAPVLLWQDAVAKSPGKARVYANLGTALHHESKLDEAIEYYCKALALDPKSRQAEANAYAIAGERLEEAVANDPSLLSGLPVGPDGTVELTVPDPCAKHGPGGSAGQKGG
jgi:hypothetical protein